MTSQQWTRDEISPFAHWAHSDITTLADGSMVTFSASNDVMLILSPDGELLASAAAAVVSAHGVTAGVTADGREVIWVADPAAGVTADGSGGFSPHREGQHGRVVALRLDGSVESVLPVPPLPVYAHSRFEPTAVLPLPFLGEIWVADGYGQSLIHRYDNSGTYLGPVRASLNGSFDCPHAMALDDADGALRILIADRQNDRVVALEPDGTLIGTVADGLRRPSSLAVHEGSILVGELAASFAHLDRNGALVERVGLDVAAFSRPGWPNALNWSGVTVAPSPAPHLFNSPHGITVDSKGRVHVVEWLLGGRHVLLTPGTNGFEAAETPLLLRGPSSR